MATDVRVRDRKTGVERNVKLKAYQLIPHRYEVLAFLDEAGNEVENPATKKSVVPVKKKEAAEPVAAEPKRSPGRPRMTEEQRAAKRQELDRMNAEAIEKVKENANKPV